MTVKELITQLELLDAGKHIYMEMSEEAGKFNIEPITESCDDDTVLGYIIVAE